MFYQQQRGKELFQSYTNDKNFALGFQRENSCPNDTLVTETL